MRLASIKIRNFRNYERVKIDFEEKGGLYTGINGSGKSNFFESIYYLSTGRTFRSLQKNDIIRYTENECDLEGRFIDESGIVYDVHFQLTRDGKKKFRVNQKSDWTLSQWFSKNCISFFSPEDIVLVTGAPAQRRQFMDIELCQLDPHYLLQLIVYKNILSQKIMLLKSQHYDATQMAIYDEQMADAGAYICMRRKNFFMEIQSQVTENFFRISNEQVNINIDIASSADIARDTHGQTRDSLYKELEKNRKRDSLTGQVAAGPHRDDIMITLGEKKYRRFASQGQCRSLAIALKWACLKKTVAATKKSAIILFDDAFSELDRKRRKHILEMVCDTGQLFVSLLEEADESFMGLPKYRIEENKIQKYEF